MHAQDLKVSGVEGGGGREASNMRELLKVK